MSRSTVPSGSVADDRADVAVLADRGGPGARCTPSPRPPPSVAAGQVTATPMSSVTAISVERRVAGVAHRVASTRPARRSRISGPGAVVGVVAVRALLQVDARAPRRSSATGRRRRHAVPDGGLARRRPTSSCTGPRRRAGRRARHRGPDGQRVLRAGHAHTAAGRRRSTFGECAVAGVGDDVGPGDGAADGDERPGRLVGVDAVGELLDVDPALRRRSSWRGRVVRLDLRRSGWCPSTVPVFVYWPVCARCALAWQRTTLPGRRSAAGAGTGRRRRMLSVTRPGQRDVAGVRRPS